MLRERIGEINLENYLNTTAGDTTKVLTGAADNTCKLWDCETGNVVVIIVVNK